VSNGWARREAQAEEVRRRLMLAFKGAQGQEMVASARGLPFEVPQCGPGDAFEAGGRIPSAGPLGGLGYNDQPPVVEQPICEWQANSELCRFGDPSFVASISVRIATGADNAPNNPQDSTTTDWSTAFVRVQFGSDNHGPFSTLDFDVMNGTSVPLIGRRARFALCYPVNAGSQQAPITQPLLDVSVSIGVNPGNSAGVRGARKTQIIGDVQQNATSQIVPIPPYASSFFYMSNDATAQVTQNQTNSPVAGSAIVATSAIGKFENLAVPVGTGARGASVTAPAALTRVRLVFLLNPA
jgi:hypothetical protein